MELRRYSFQRDVEERKEKDLRLGVVNNIKMYYSDDDIMRFSQTTTFFFSLSLSLSFFVSGSALTQLFPNDFFVFFRFAANSFQ